MFVAWYQASDQKDYVFNAWRLGMINYVLRIRMFFTSKSKFMVHRYRVLGYRCFHGTHGFFRAWSLFYILIITWMFLRMVRVLLDLQCLQKGLRNMKHIFTFSRGPKNSLDGAFSLAFVFL